MRLTPGDIQRIREERDILIPDLERPGVLMIFNKLNEAADKITAKYDKAQTIEEVIYIQCFRQIVKQEIPKIFNNIVNIDEPALSSEKWSFLRWLTGLVR